MNVLSPFDGMSCGQRALEEAGIVVNKYYASEIDPYAIQVTQSNYPNTIQLGDVSNVKGDQLDKIDLLIGGSPCQGFSDAGKHLNFKDPRSILFFEFLRLLDEVKPTFFMLENVNMRYEWQDIITNYLGVKPIRINSNNFTACDRDRLYWTNIPVAEVPSRTHNFGDFREWGVDDKYYYSEKAFNWLSKQARSSGRDLKLYTNRGNMQMLEASMCKKYSSQRFFGVMDLKGVRYITPVECERLQGLPDNYSAAVSDTQRYKMLGNGWNVPTIAHIFNGMHKRIGRSFTYIEDTFKEFTW